MSAAKDWYSLEGFIYGEISSDYQNENIDEDLIQRKNVSFKKSYISKKSLDDSFSTPVVLGFPKSSIDNYTTSSNQFNPDIRITSKYLTEFISYLNLSKEEIASVLQVSVGTIANLENKISTHPRKQTIIQINELHEMLQFLIDKLGNKKFLIRSLFNNFHPSLDTTPFDFLKSTNENKISEVFGIFKRMYS